MKRVIIWLGIFVVFGLIGCAHVDQSKGANHFPSERPATGNEVFIFDRAFACQNYKKTSTSLEKFISFASKQKKLITFTLPSFDQRYFSKYIDYILDNFVPQKTIIWNRHFIISWVRQGDLNKKTILYVHDHTIEDNVIGIRGWLLSPYTNLDFILKQNRKEINFDIKRGYMHMGVVTDFPEYNHALSAFYIQGHLSNNESAIKFKILKNGRILAKEKIKI